MAAINFDVDNTPPSTGFDAIPAGKYKAVIVESEEKATKKGDGSYIKFTFQIIEGPFENRKLWSQLNLNNPNDQAVSIARAELAAIALAVGVKMCRDTVQLHELPLMIRVAAKPDKETGELRNEIKGYEAATAGGTTTAKPAAAATDTKTPPWKRN